MKVIKIQLISIQKIKQVLKEKNYLILMKELNTLKMKIF